MARLKRTLSLGSVVLFGIAYMTPSSSSGLSASSPRPPRTRPRRLHRRFLAMLFTALSYGAMAKAFPIAGSVYSYAQRGIHPMSASSPAGCCCSTTC